MERGWAINLGGGFHHCHAEKGGGFCAYADITLSLKFLFERVEGVAKAMIIDLDAHQVSSYQALNLTSLFIFTYLQHHSAILEDTSHISLLMQKLSYL